jgi:hypothetical protein
VHPGPSRVYGTLLRSEPKIEIISTRLSVLSPSALYSSTPLSLSTPSSLPLALLFPSSPPPLHSLFVRGSSLYSSVARSLSPLCRSFPRHTATRLFPVTTRSTQCEEGWAEFNELLWLALPPVPAAPDTSLLSSDYYIYITHLTSSSIARRKSLAALHPG